MHRNFEAAGKSTCRGFISAELVGAPLALAAIGWLPLEPRRGQAPRPDA